MAERLLVDSTDVTAIAWNITHRGARWKVPGRRGGNRAMPGMHGTLRLAGKPFEENTLVLTMWAVGCNTDGSFPSGDRAAVVRGHLDTLSRLFAKSGLLYLVQERPDGNRECYAECVQAIDFASMAGGSRAEFGVELLVPKAFWRSIASANQTILAPSASTLTFSTFLDSTAPLTEMVYDVTGPIVSPQLTDPVTGQWVKYNGSLAGGQVWTIDSANWTSVVAGSSVLNVTTHGMGATLLDISPDPAGPKIAVAGTGQSAATSVKVTGRKAYLLA